MTNWSWSATSSIYSIHQLSVPRHIPPCHTTSEITPAISSALHPAVSHHLSHPAAIDNTKYNIYIVIKTINFIRVEMNSDKALLIILSCCLLICFILIYSLINSKSFYSAVKSIFNSQLWNHFNSLDRVAPGGTNSTRLVLQCRSLVLVASDFAPINQTQSRLGSPQSPQ